MNCADPIGLLELESEITKHRQRVEDQEVLISVLEHDGHDVSEQEALLRVERVTLSLKIVQQIKLVGDNSTGALR
jgi:hypothetical protein